MKYQKISVKCAVKMIVETNCLIIKNKKKL